MSTNPWELYIKYLHDWADSHSEPEFMGESPACYEEWLENEYEEDENEERTVNDSCNYDYCDGDCMSCDNYNCVLCENEKRITLL